MLHDNVNGYHVQSLYLSMFKTETNGINGNEPKLGVSASGVESDRVGIEDGEFVGFEGISVGMNVG